MAETVSLKSMHLEYRLWIAELNFDINLIRIFNDRLIEIAQENKGGNPKSTFDEFSKQFSSTRETIDEIRHRMHIEKMTLASTSRQHQGADLKIPVTDTYTSIRNEFFKFRVAFNELKSAFLRFEVN